MFVKYIKFASLSAVLLAFFIPTVSLAIDQRCWTKAACEKGDANNMPGLFYGPNSETVKACKMDEDLVTKDKVGFCSAAGYAKTEIEFGAGNNQFANFGKFIEWFYQYAIIVASILAIFMIIFSGFQWATSGGSPEKITEARKKIGGAMMGLFLAVLAYFILNTVNPYLVHLRLPQVWRINTSSLTPPYCDQLKDRKVSETEGGPFNLDPVKDPLHASFCGKEYFIEGSSLTCLGRSCDGSVCMDSGKVDAKSKPIYQCYKGVLGGKISAQRSLLCDDLKGNIIDATIGNPGMKLIAVCNDTTLNKNLEFAGLSPSLSDDAREYLFGEDFRSKVENACSSSGGVVGFYLGADVNDEGGGLIGWFCEGIIGSSGIDDWHAIGRNPATGNCDQNLALAAFDLIGKREPDCENQGARDCSCGTISHADVVKKLIANDEYKEYLFTKEQLLQGLPCDINIDRGEFPAVKNTALWNNMQFDTSCDFMQNWVNIAFWKEAALLE